MEEGALITSADVPALFLRYHGVLVGYAARRVGIDQAEDMVQEAWFRLLRALQARTEIRAGAVKDWLYRVVTNLTIDWLRRERVVLWEPLDGAEQHVGTENPEQAVIARDLVRRGLELRTGEECYLLLLGQRGYTNQEIGQHMGMQADTAKVRVFRLKRALAAWYERQEVA